MIDSMGIKSAIPQQKQSSKPQEPPLPMRETADLNKVSLVATVGKTVSEFVVVDFSRLMRQGQRPMFKLFFYSTSRLSLRLQFKVLSFAMLLNPD
jgi:hypothetical protein